MHDGASDECVAACTRLAHQIQSGKIVVAVDSEASGEEILREYLKVVGESSRAGIGSKLATRLWRLRHSESVCRQVKITSASEGRGAFSEVPASLHDFDHDDHKWIAVAVAEGDNPPVYQAKDSEWWARRDDLLASGVDVQFLCASDFIDGLS